MAGRIGVDTILTEEVAVGALRQKGGRDIDNRGAEQGGEFEQLEVVHLVPARDIFDTSVEPSEDIIPLHV